MKDEDARAPGHPVGAAPGGPGGSCNRRRGRWTRRSGRRRRGRPHGRRGAPRGREPGPGGEPDAARAAVPRGARLVPAAGDRRGPAGVCRASDPPGRGHPSLSLPQASLGHAPGSGDGPLRGARPGGGGRRGGAAPRAAGRCPGRCPAAGGSDRREQERPRRDSGPGVRGRHRGRGPRGAGGGRLREGRGGGRWAAADDAHLSPRGRGARPVDGSPGGAPGGSQPDRSAGATALSGLDDASTA